MDELDEKVLDITQRQKRAMILRRYHAKVERARELSQKRLAPEKNIKKRAYAQARQIVRKRFAGARGAEYEKLGPSEKIAIDRAIEKKQALIKKLALRLIPRVKQAEAKRLQSFMKGQSVANAGAKEGHAPVVEDLNSIFAETFTGMSDEKKKAEAGSKKNDAVVFYGKFDDEKSNKTPTYKAIAKKAVKADVSEEILGVVYDRGLEAWTEECKVSAQQYAFARVNSYINQGKSYFNEDADLREGLKDPEDNPCWTGYKPVGTKKLRGKTVPNCVPEAVESIVPQTTSPGSKTRKKIETVDRQPPHTELVKQTEIQRKIIEKKEGNCETDPAKREIGTDSLVKAFKKDTPGQSLDESFNIEFAAGIGQTLTAGDLGMKIKGGFAFHPSVIQDEEEIEEDVKTADKEPVVIPAHKDVNGNTIPAKTVLRKADKKIIKSGNVHDGED